MKPQEPIPHNYSIRGLNLIFALSSIGLLMSTALIVGYDYVRGWKWFQREFMRMQQERIESDLRAAQLETNKTQLADLDRRVRENEVDIARHRDQYVLAQKDLDRWEGEHYAADQDFRFAKARLDAQRYIAEASVVEKRSDGPRQNRCCLSQYFETNSSTDTGSRSADSRAAVESATIAYDVKCLLLCAEPSLSMLPAMDLEISARSP